jgi:hypothetical protein
MRVKKTDEVEPSKTATAAAATVPGDTADEPAYVAPRLELMAAFPEFQRATARAEKLKGELRALEDEKSSLEARRIRPNAGLPMKGSGEPPTSKEVVDEMLRLEHRLKEIAFEIPELQHRISTADSVATASRSEARSQVEAALRADYNGQAIYTLRLWKKFSSHCRRLLAIKEAIRSAKLDLKIHTVDLPFALFDDRAEMSALSCYEKNLLNLLDADKTWPPYPEQIARREAKESARRSARLYHHEVQAAYQKLEDRSKAAKRSPDRKVITAQYL